MPSELRQLIRLQMALYANQIKLSQKARILDVGIGGDKERPSENFKYFPSKNFKTMDIDIQWHPDFVGDICQTDFYDNYWDLIILSQTLEHIWEFKKSIKEIYRILKPESYAIIDSPFVYPHHPEQNFADYWRFSPQALTKLCQEIGFQGEAKLIDNILTTMLCYKPKK